MSIGSAFVVEPPCGELDIEINEGTTMQSGLCYAVVISHLCISW